jgi:hypothetical protein
MDLSAKYHEERETEEVKIRICSLVSEDLSQINIDASADVVKWSEITILQHSLHTYRKPYRITK